MKQTLIVPCAGKSTRFPNMKPKWLLTHPDGELMIEKAITGLNLDAFDRIVITIVKAFEEKYEAELILKQLFKNNSKVEICVLDDFTKSASETVYNTLNLMNVTGAFVVKDSDNRVVIDDVICNNNFVAGYDLHKHPDISNIPGKSFILTNEQSIIQDIIEKKVVSNIISLGVYGFQNTESFKSAYEAIIDSNIASELFVSHVISYLISNKQIFEYREASGYDDWGTLIEWQEVQKRHRTYFIDVDGVILKNSGKYGNINWSNNTEIILENIEEIRRLQNNGAQIVITTSRTEEYRENLERVLRENGITPYAIIMGLNHSTRVLINDFAPTNPYPSGIAITLPRNCLIKDYL